MPSLVGFHPDRLSASLTPADHVAAGAVSSVLTRLCGQPLDVLKIRMQLQVEAGAEAKFKGVFHATATMLKEEGVKSFWKGHMPAQYLSISYGVFQFGTFQAATKALYGIAPGTAEEGLGRAAAHFGLGATAGIAATLASYPFDVVRTRLVAQGNERAYAGTVDAAGKMWRAEGARAFFRGLVPTLATVGPYSGLQFGFYALFNQIFDPVLSSGRISMSKSVLCGGLAGFCAKIAVFPFDTTKKRLQVQGFSHGRQAFGRTDWYSGMVDCMAKVLKKEGVGGLYKGLTPGLAKAALSTALNFWFYEWSCSMVALRHVNER